MRMRHAVLTPVAILAALALVFAGLIFWLGRAGDAQGSNAWLGRGEAGQAEDALKAQAAALLGDDQKGWLAAVDPEEPELRQRYAAMFRSLRGLDVTHFEYQLYRADQDSNVLFAVEVVIKYCFSVRPCPVTAGDADGAPWIAQILRFRQIDGRFVIAEVGEADQRNEGQPVPWETDELFFARGDRVIVASGRAGRSQLENVRGLAEKAAKVADRFGVMIGNEQPRYRVLIADDKAWASWYGSSTGKDTVGYTIFLNEAGADVVLRLSDLDSPAEMTKTLQHEFGHVVMSSGRIETDDVEDGWLEEGLAEYIGSQPGAATDSWRREAVHDLVRGGDAPDSMVLPQLAEDATTDEIDAYYGHGHFVADCLADTFGEPKLIEFGGHVLRSGESYQAASLTVFGKPFAEVDKACVGSIRRRA